MRSVLLTLSFWGLLSASLTAQTVRLKSSEGFIQASGSVRIFYRFLGEGKDTIVVFHGGGFGSAYMVPDLAPLAAHHTLLFFDQPGTGYSSEVTDTARLNINRFIEDVETLRSHFHLDKMKVLAHSNGGLMFGKYAIAHPERLSAVVLVNPTTASQHWPYANRFDSATLLLLRQNRKRYYAAPADTIKACWDYYAVWARGKFPTPVHARRIWGDVCNCNQRNLLSPALFYPLQSMGRWDITAALSNVKARTLVIGGDKDEAPVDVFAEWKNSLPDSRLLIIKGAGHLPYVDNPAVFFAATEKFFQNEWPEESVQQAGGAGVILSGDKKGSAYQQARAAVIEIEDELVRLVNRQSWDSVAAVYVQDAYILAPGAPPVSGRKAIASFWRTVSGRGMQQLELQLVDLEQSGDKLTARGKYVMYDKGGAILDLGKFIAIYRKEKGSWRLQTDMFNTSMETRSPVEIPDYLSVGEK